MLTDEQFMKAVLKAFELNIDSDEVVRVMLDEYNISCTQEQIEQMYAYFEIAIDKPTIH